MPPDSSAIQPLEVVVPRRSKDSCRRCQDYDLICSPLQFQTESRCENCHNAGASCEYGQAAEHAPQRKRRKTHHKATDDSTESEVEGESHPPPTRNNTQREVATFTPFGSDSSYADPELDDFSLSTNMTAKGSTLVQGNSTSKKSSSDTILVQGARISKKSQDNKTCSISPTNKPSTQSSYEDPEFGNFSVTIIKEPANKVSATSQRNGGIKKRGSERKMQPKSFASPCAKPELDEFAATRKSKAKGTNCMRKNANRKKSPQGLPSKGVLKQPMNSAATSAGSDTDGETRLMLNPHGMTNVAKFGLLRSQALAYKKEEERKRQERLSLGLLEEEESISDFHVCEPEPYDGYSSSEDKEQERQRKARSITANSSSEHSGYSDAKHSSLPPVLDPNAINSPSHQPSDTSSHASLGGKDDRIPESSHECEKVAPDTAYPALPLPTHPKDAFRPNDSEIDSLENIPQAVPTLIKDISSASNAASQLVVRESPRKPRVPEPMVLEDHEDEDEDEIPQAIPTAYVAPRNSHVVVAPVQVHGTKSDKRGMQLQEPETTSGIESPNKNIKDDSASITKAQIPPSEHVEEGTPIRDASQLERVELALSPGNKPEIQEVPFPSTAPQRQSSTIQVKDTPYPLTKSVAYKTRAATGLLKTLGSDKNPAGLCLEDDEIILGTARDSSSSFEVVIPVYQGIKRKNDDENPTTKGKKGWKMPRVRKLEFGSQEAGFKDLGDLAKEHKKRYLESVGSSVKSAEAGSVPQVIDEHKNMGVKAPDEQRTLAGGIAAVAQLPPPPPKPLLSVNTAISSPTPMQPSIPKPKVSPVSVAQMSSSSRHSSTGSAHVKQRREKPPPKPESSTQKALKAIIAAKRASLSGHLPGSISPSNASFTTVSPASRRSSSTASRPSQKVMKPSSSRSALHSVPSHVSASRFKSLLDQRSPSRQAHPPTIAAQHVLQFLNSDDTASDAGDVISARPLPPLQDVQRTLIPTVAAVPPPEKPERIDNYAGIEGRNVNVLIPGYNRLSTEKKIKLNDLRKAYFGPGELEMQPSASVTAEEESRQRRIQEFRDRLKKEMPKKKPWWQEDDTPVGSYSRKLGAVKSVKQDLERRDEGITRVEVERLSRGSMVKNVMRML